MQNASCNEGKKDHGWQVSEDFNQTDSGVEVLRVDRLRCIRFSAGVFGQGTTPISRGTPEGTCVFRWGVKEKVYKRGGEVWNRSIK